MSQIPSWPKRLNPFACKRGARSPRLSRRRLGAEQLESRRMLAINPTGLEQEMLELVNRVRADPQGELEHLFLSTTAGDRDYFVSADSHVNAAISFFNTNAAAFLSQWSTLTATTPVAWNEPLTDSARLHSQEMIDQNEQSHQLSGEPALLRRAENAGYNWSGSVSVGENVYAYQENNFHGHAAFLIDWGDGPYGIQDPAGHRDNLMDSRWQEVGISILSSPRTGGNDVGPLVVTQDFGRRGNFGNPMILGVAFTDADGDQFYDNGEGRGNITITATDGTTAYTTTSMTAGGYQMAVPNGTYTVTASGGGLDGAKMLGTAVVAGKNVKLDLETASAASASGTLRGRVFADRDEDGIQDASGESGLGGWTVFADANNNGTLDAGEAHATTTSNGDYTLATHGPGTFTIATDAPFGFRTSDAGTAHHTATVSIGQTVSDLNFARYQDIQLGGSAVHVYGTDGADSLVYQATTTHTLTINGRHYALAPAVYDTLNLYGRSGDDSLSIVANSGDDTITMAPGSVHLAGTTTAANGTSYDYTVHAISFRDVDADLGEGTDNAKLQGGGNDDDLIVHPSRAHMNSFGFSHQVEGFHTLYAEADQGGKDRVYAYDSSSNDIYIGRKEFSVLKGAQDEFFVHMQGFERNFAYSEKGGTDYAYFYDSASNDNFFGRVEYAVMQDPDISYFNYAKGFARTFGYATAGGFDQAFLSGSTGDDRYFGKSNLASIRGASFEYFNQAEQFERTFTYGGQGGDDRASFFGSSGDDRFTAYPQASTWRGPADSFYHVVNDFDEQIIYASEGGNDQAVVYDGAANDLFFGRNDDSFLARTDYFLRLINVEEITLHGFNGPTNRLNVDSLDYALQVNGPWV